MTAPTGCAHLKVEYRPRHDSGRVFARWVCEGCWEPFAPTPEHDGLLWWDVARLREALEASVTLQSHYAALLNTWDGGRRILFKDAADWLARLSMTPEERMRDPRTRDDRREP